MGAKRAVDGITELISRTGGAGVKSVVTVDQVYAEMQHEALEFRHPRGGRAKYLEAPMFESHRRWIGAFATRFLNARTETAKLWHDGPGQSLQKVVKRNAPVEFNDLRRSAGLETFVGRTPRFVNPPEQRRLSEWELEGKDHMRASGLGYRE